MSFVGGKLPDHCTCGHQLGDLTAPYSNGHLLTCIHNFGYTSTNRHHCVVRAIQAVCDAFNFTTVREPSNLHPTLRPDLLVSVVPPVLIDVSIVCPVLAASDLAVDTRATEKSAKYDGMASDLNAVTTRSLPTLGSLERVYSVYSWSTLLKKCVLFSTQL